MRCLFNIYESQEFCATDESSTQKISHFYAGTPEKDELLFTKTILVRERWCKAT